MRNSFSKSLFIICSLILLNNTGLYANPFDDDGIFTKIGNGVVNTYDKVKDKAGDVKDAVVDKAKEVKDTVVDKAGDVKDAVVDKAKDAKNAVSSTYEKASNNIIGLFKKKNPSYINEAIFLPGHESKEMVCQGIAYLPTKVSDATKQGDGSYCQYVLLSFYPKDSKQPSQLVVIDRKTSKAIKRYPLYKSNGKAYTGHAGGIAVAGKYVWVASGGTIYGFDTQEVIDFIDDTKTEAKAEKGLPKSFDKLPAKKLTCVKTYDVDSKASYVSFDGKYIWVGDFTKGKNYQPTPHHKVMGRNCWIAGYLVDSDGYPKSTTVYTYKDGDSDEKVHKPDAIIAMRDSVQGMAVCGDYIALTISYGAVNSKLAFYKNPLKSKGETVSYTPKGAKTYSVEAWELEGDKNWIHTVSLAAGAEDLEYDGENLYVTFECSSKNYKTKWSLNPLVKITEDFYIIDPKKIIK